MKHLLTKLTLLLLCLSIFTACEVLNIPVKKEGTNQNVVGSWFGSYDNTNSDLEARNILITFNQDLTYSIDEETETGSFTFQPSNAGTFNIADGILSLTSTTCVDRDTDCELSTILSGEEIRLYRDKYSSGLQIDSGIGWHFYEGDSEGREN